MLWRLALHSGFLHPDFLRDKLTDRQLHEISWYWERHPFGHEIDHIMLAKIVCAFAGGDPTDYIPQAMQGEAEIHPGMFPGIEQFAEQEGIDLGDNQSTNDPDEGGQQEA